MTLDQYLAATGQKTIGTRAPPRMAMTHADIADHQLALAEDDQKAGDAHDAAGLDDCAEFRWAVACMRQLAATAQMHAAEMAVLDGQRSRESSQRQRELRDRILELSNGLVNAARNIAYDELLDEWGLASVGDRTVGIGLGGQDRQDRRA